MKCSKKFLKYDIDFVMSWNCLKLLLRFIVEFNISKYCADQTMHLRKGHKFAIV